MINEGLLMNDYSELLESISKNTGNPHDAFMKLYQWVNKTIGIKLFTLTTFDIPNAVAQRVYSNMPIEYPVSGVKPIEKSTWTETVLDNHKSFVANNIDDIAEVFSDFKLIQSLGCESVCNLPIITDGKLLGTVNCLDVKNYFTAKKIKELENIKLPAISCFLLYLLRKK
ncbi:hypothetical protein OAN64_01270 [Candidatus Pseudothioglobus singularis]|mgnify:FL=1|jgi:hypothetical protein|nr:hypothetical protein [Candidatus Pseudothioglobus singularis]